MISWSPNTYKCDQSQWRMGDGRYVWCWWYGLVGIIRADAWFAPLDEPLYERYSSCLLAEWDSGTHSNICRCINNIITDILGIVGSWECCTALSAIVKYQWRISTKPELPVLNFNTGIIILLEVNIESLWCSCPALPDGWRFARAMAVVEGKLELSIHFTSL